MDPLNAACGALAALTPIEASAVTDALCDWAENEACSLADMDDADVPVQRAALLLIVQGVVDRLNAARAALATNERSV